MSLPKRRSNVMDPAEVDQHADDIARRWQVVATLAGRLHIIDRDQTKAAYASSGWTPRAACGVANGAPQGDYPLRPTSQPLGEALATSGLTKPWCHQCVGFVRRAYRTQARREAATDTPMAGASATRVMLVGPINRKRAQAATYPGFRQAADYLRNQFVQVSDPSDMLRDLTKDVPYADHVRAHMEMFWEADAIVAMEGWEGSNMATLAIMTARAVQIPVLELSRFGGITPSEHSKWQPWCEPLLRDEGKKEIW